MLITLVSYQVLMVVSESVDLDKHALEHGLDYLE